MNNTIIARGCEFCKVCLPLNSGIYLFYQEMLKVHQGYPLNSESESDPRTTDKRRLNT